MIAAHDDDDDTTNQTFSTDTVHHGGLKLCLALPQPRPAKVVAQALKFERELQPRWRPWAFNVSLKSLYSEPGQVR